MANFFATVGRTGKYGMEAMQFLDMLLHVDKSLGILIDQYGVWIYVILFLVVFGETGFVVLPFLPGDSLLFIAGTYCATGQMDVVILTVLLCIAAIGGNTLNYSIGALFGSRILQSRRQWIKPDHLHKTQLFFAQHGGKTIILARFTPIVRTVAPFIAGMTAMSFMRFQMFNIIGGLAWVLGLVLLGYVSGNLPFVRDNLNILVLVGLGIAVLPLAGMAIWQVCKRFR